MIVNRAGQFLIEKRPFKGVLHDLWQFPTTDFVGEPFLESAHSLGQVKHVFSHFKLTVDVYAREAEGEGTWIHVHEMQDYAFSTLMRKVFALYTIPNEDRLKKAA